MMPLAWQGIRLEKRGQTILDAVDLELRPGELLGLCGPNGAGKTALLRTAIGLERCSAGVVRTNGRALYDLSGMERARQMAYLPQSAEAAWPISVGEAVLLGRLPHGRRIGPEDLRLRDEALAAVGLTALAARPLTALSGGERALALLARAIAVGAPVLLLDEPGAALDPSHQLTVMRLFRRLAEAGTAICLVLHDLALAARFCDRIALLDAGRLVAEGPAEAVLNDERLASVYAVRGIRQEIDGSLRLVAWSELPSSPAADGKGG